MQGCSREPASPAARILDRHGREALLLRHFAVAVFCFALCAIAHAAAPAAVDAILRQRTDTKAPLDYFERLPTHYGCEQGNHYPLIIYLHGAGEVGTDPARMLKWNVPSRVDPEGGPSRVPFVVLFPQRTEAIVAASRIDAFLDYAIDRYCIDRARIYMVGFSAGAAQTLSYAYAYPQRLAAGVAISGFWANDGGMGAIGFASSLAPCALLMTPLWLFHAKDDDKVPFSQLASLLDKLKSCPRYEQHAPRLTTFSGGGHSIDSAVLNGSLLDQGEKPRVVFEPDIYNWLLQHRRD